VIGRQELIKRRWASFANSELLPPIMNWINPVIGKAPSSAEILAAAEKYSEGMVSVVEKALEGKKFLVGDELTMADLFVVAAIARGYQFVSSIYECNRQFINPLNRFSRRSGRLLILTSTNTI
jgi:glutathione S-transferase